MLRPWQFFRKEKKIVFFNSGLTVENANKKKRRRREDLIKLSLHGIAITEVATVSKVNISSYQKKEGEKKSFPKKKRRKKKRDGESYDIVSKPCDSNNFHVFFQLLYFPFDVFVRKTYKEYPHGLTDDFNN